MIFILLSAITVFIRIWGQPHRRTVKAFQPIGVLRYLPYTDWNEDGRLDIVVGNFILENFTTPVRNKQGVSYDNRLTKQRLSVQSEAESAIAIAIYYAIVARLLLSHDHKTNEYSSKSLEESFTDLGNKKWMAPELKELFFKAQNICQDARKWYTASSEK